MGRPERSPRLLVSVVNAVFFGSLSLLIAAAGPLSQTVRLVRVDTPTADSHTPDEFALEFSGAWLESPQADAPAHNNSSNSSDNKAPAKPAQSLQLLSGYWDSAASFQLPVWDLPPHQVAFAPMQSNVSTPLSLALPVVASPPEFIPLSRGPPRA